MVDGYGYITGNGTIRRRCFCAIPARQKQKIDVGKKYRNIYLLLKQKKNGVLYNYYKIILD